MYDFTVGRAINNSSALSRSLCKRVPYHAKKEQLGTATFRRVFLGVPVATFVKVSGSSMFPECFVAIEPPFVIVHRVGRWGSEARLGHRLCFRIQAGQCRYNMRKAILEIAAKLREVCLGDEVGRDGSARGWVGQSYGAGLNQSIGWKRRRRRRNRRLVIVGEGSLFFQRQGASGSWVVPTPRRVGRGL
ncbi:hypothetical protein CALCODRAFT_508710 [Calocera cornea HHB12733]|uniref:Uncharacterized protein n=1 Tax=Calocera cornea HHB12733 TaxID=1353952 RepID=A0A165G4Z0_9BASI|nr:hypothetical protein CALCODRAFT_508710 [Calocera cornea HHB12733]